VVGVKGLETAVVPDEPRAPVDLSTGGAVHFGSDGA
jgi:hypothetical protein